MSNKLPLTCDIVPINDEEETWIFGYGSLVWKADFPYEEKRTGYIKGYIRRFFQNSIEHRGTREKPGRVVTLVHSDDPESRVWGMGYRIARNNTNDVLEHLDHREKNGYERNQVKFYPHPSSETQSNDSKDILLYVATHENPSFAGQHDSLDQIATQILGATGESGKNVEYVYKLAEAMRQLYPGQEDDHLFELEQILRTRNPGVANGACDGKRSNLSKEG